MNPVFFDNIAYLLVGASLQTCIMLYPFEHDDIVRFLRVLAWSLAAFLPIEGIDRYVIGFHLLVFGTAFLCGTFIIFRARFLPNPSEGAIVFVGTIFLYLVGTVFGWGTRPIIVLTCIFAALFFFLCLPIRLPRRLAALGVGA